MGVKHKFNPDPEYLAIKLLRKCKIKKKRSPREAWRCGSTKKVVFPSFEAAVTRGNQIRAEDPKAPMFRTYNCSFCGQWHLTSQL